MNVPVKEVNQERVLHTYQQEDLKIRRQMSTVRDTLKHGEMKLIKEVLEVPTAQLDVGHIAVHCCTMRCYSCSGLGHKAQNCGNTRKQSLRSYLDNSSG